MLAVPAAVELLNFLLSQVVERRRTPAEIREEFERLQREREERRLQQRTNPKVKSSRGPHLALRPFLQACVFSSDGKSVKIDGEITLLSLKFRLAALSVIPYCSIEMGLVEVKLNFHRGLQALLGQPSLAVVNAATLCNVVRTVVPKGLNVPSLKAPPDSGAMCK